MKTHQVLIKIFCLFLVTPTLYVAAQSVAVNHKHKPATLGVQSFQVICDAASTKGKTTEVMLTNNGNESALVVFEYREPADKSGRTNAQSGLRYKVGAKQSMSLNCNDLLARGSQKSTSLAMTVSAQPFEGVSVVARYKSLNSDSVCSSTILPIDKLNVQSVGTHGTFCPGCSLDSKGICCNDLCCEGDCIDGACQANSFTVVEDES